MWGGGRPTYPTVQFVREVDALLDAAVAAATSLRQSRWRRCGGRWDGHWDVTHITGHLPKSRSNIWRSVGRHFWPTTSVNNTEYAARKAYKQFCLRSLLFFYCSAEQTSLRLHTSTCVCNIKMPPSKRTEHTKRELTNNSIMAKRIQCQGILNEQSCNRIAHSLKIIIWISQFRGSLRVSLNLRAANFTRFAGVATSGITLIIIVLHLHFYISASILNDNKAIIKYSSHQYSLLYGSSKGSGLTCQFLKRGMYDLWLQIK